MSVPTWKRKLSEAEFVYQVYQLNIRLGEILENKPQKYKANYTDEIVKTALSALENVQKNQKGRQWNHNILTCLRSSPS